MKKLSEIGSNVWPYPNLGGEPKCYMLKEPAGDGHTMEILLTQDERRELVREAIHYFCMKPYSSPETHEEFCARLGEFIKEQGL